MEENKNIRVIFTKKADLILANIVKTYNLEEQQEEILIFLTKDFAKENTSEKELIDSLQKETGVSQEMAEKISKDIIINLAPFLQKAPESKFEDPSFREEMAEKIFGEEANTTNFKFIKNDLENISETPTIMTTPVEKKSTIPASPRPRVRKPITTPEVKKFPPTNSVPPTTQQSSGPDAYREPIE